MRTGGRSPSAIDKPPEKSHDASHEHPVEDGEDLHGHPLPQGGRHREGDDQPAGEAQRLPAADGGGDVDAFTDAREDPAIGVVLLTGAGPHTDGKYAFCAGGDQSVRGPAGYVDEAGVPRLNVLDLQKLIRSMPKVVIALVAGYAIGGGHVLHVVCDLTIAADNAVFGQVGPKMGSFDGGFGSSYLARIVGQKKAREIWYLCRQYDARRRWRWAWSTRSCRSRELEAEGVKWASEILENSPLAIRCLKSAFNAGRRRPGGHPGTRRATPRCSTT